MAEHMEEQEESSVEEVTLLKEAKEMGWVPKEEFQGPEERWSTAKDFVERGQHILPLLQANNKKLKADLLTRDHKISRLEQSVEESQAAIKALQKTYTETTRLQVEEAKKGLKEQIRKAKSEGDIDAEMTLLDQLDELKAATVEKAIEVREEQKPPALHPEFIAWNKDNPWFGNLDIPEYRKRTKALMRIVEDLREDGESSSGRPFMDKCMEILEDRESEVSRKPSSKVENSAPGERKSTSSVGFSGLPKEAKDACHADNSSFVGPGKMYKTVKEWEDHFTSIYLAQG